MSCVQPATIYGPWTCIGADIQAHDLVMDEQAKIRWQRAKPPGVVVGLPGYLVGGEWVGVSRCSGLPATLVLMKDYGRL